MKLVVSIMLDFHFRVVAAEDFPWIKKVGVKNPFGGFLRIVRCVDLQGSIGFLVSLLRSHCLAAGAIL